VDSSATRRIRITLLDTPADGKRGLVNISTGRKRGMILQLERRENI